MKPARLIVAGIAGVAGFLALVLTSRTPSPNVVEVSTPQKVATTEVLVAKAELAMGATLNKDNIGWMSWPRDLAAVTMVQRPARPNAIEEFNGGIVRANFFPNEPIREEKVIKGNGAGFLSAILPAGKKAVAITIDSRGASSAGGFILPNDYVDVIAVRQFETAGRGAEAFRAATLLSNIRVLAIGQSVEERNGERAVVGETATLELDASQAEAIILAQRSGTLSLALRSMSDVNKPEEAGPSSDGVVIVRFGVTQEVSK